MKAALIVVAKKPEPGLTKTRLCPPFTPEEAAQFYSCLMLDTLALAARLDCADHILAYTPAGAKSYFETLAPDGFRLVAQQGKDLGERLANALAHHFELGYQRVVIMNSDGPTLPLIYLNQAFAGLDHDDITLGMGHDGGYYLIGMKRLQASLFRGISWSTGRVIAQTLEACRSLELKVHKLPEWYDVDVAADLDRLRCDLAQDQAAAPRTRAFLQSSNKIRLPAD
ncbi:MAG: TIGR04282 family arsenosugar biosynthesis glycosyltransferase [Deltaproteobacteria bacterium]|nr:MAG: TIGR04282 family arsenosugar biosynthesis glycosyltransferase [Deltaproteobacteria bacterium]